METQGIPSTLQSQTPLSPPPCPAACSQGQLPSSSGALPSPILPTPKQSQAPLLPPPRTLPCSPPSLLSHLHTAPCTQHHVSKQLTLPRELGGRERGGGKGGTSSKSSLGSHAEALPIPATRGLQAPRLGLCWLALEFPSSHDQIPKNEKLGPGPEEGEAKAEQGGRVAGEGCLLRLGRWRCTQRQLLWDDPEGLTTTANPNMLFFRGRALGVFQGVGGPSLLWSHLLGALTWLVLP